MCKPYKKETPQQVGSGFMPATRRDVVVLLPKKRRAVSSRRKTKSGTREVHSPMEAAQSIRGNNL
ncbi:hypothetical protein [Galbibacter sp. PAP.153]|uniref:hypothetical protein n=1 Tax=Galbibacter sp. PAP.153 TaxID=3104623 RepID=UPI0030089ACE